MKTCNTCNKEKHIEDFPTDRFTKDGYKHRCKECTAKKKKEYNKQRFQKNYIKSECSNSGFGTGDDWIFC